MRGSEAVTSHEQALLRAAARNNAEWCAVMCRSHGLASRFGDQVWTAPARTPPFYPDAVTLAPGTDAGAVISRIDRSRPGASVKDSFADLDLTRAGFEVLFDAQWLHRPADAPLPQSDLTCATVRDADELRRWARAWDRGEGHQDLFRPELLDDADTTVLAAYDLHGSVTAGAVASRSERVVGISNLFAVDGGSDTAWPAVLHAVHDLFPALPVVTYDRGDDLAAALRHGFEALGALRVWLRK
jgi:hypothetical protein